MSGSRGCGREFGSREKSIGCSILCPTGMFNNASLFGFTVVPIQHSYFSEDKMKKAISLIGLLMTLAIPSGLLAQQGGYSQTNLVSNTAGGAKTTDSQLLNPS